MGPSSTLTSDYLQVIEEEIKANSMVTFKWLSRKLKIHNTIAKILLQEFLQSKENKTKYAVTFALYGKKNNGDLILSLVEEKDLAVVKNDIAIVDQHIYSLHLTNSTFDPDTIYNIDKATHEMKQLNLSSIKYNKDIVRKSVAVQSTPNAVIESQRSSPLHVSKTTQPAPQTEDKKQESPVQENSSPTQNKVTNGNSGGGKRKAGVIKPMTNTKGSISCFFQKQAAKGNDTTTSSRNSSLSDDASERSNGAIKPEKNTEPPSNSESTKKEKCRADTSKQESKSGETENILPSDNYTAKTEPKLNLSQNSQNPSKNTSKLKKPKSKKAIKQKKMKRIILQSDSSSCSDASEDESRISEPEFEEPEPVVEPAKNESPAILVTHGKKRKRKIIENTVMDDDGFLHTSKEIVYESCGSDEENETVSNNQNSDINKRLKIDESDDVRQKISNNRETNKIQNQKTKQSSIMNFFKKPQKTT